MRHDAAHQFRDALSQQILTVGQPTSSPSPPPAAPTPPPGWHPDPSGRHEHRWYDGTSWTAHVSDAGQTAEDPI